MTWIEPVSGYLGGAVGIAVTHPLDTVRIRAQFLAQTESMKPSLMKIVKTILKHDGAFGFFRGILPPVVFRGVSMAVQRGTYNVGEKYFQSNNPYIQSCVIGAWAGFFTGICDSPIHLLKTRIQISNEHFKETLGNYFRFACKIAKNEGICVVFRGFHPNMYLYMGQNALFYLLYNGFLETKKYPVFLCGMMAAVISWPPFYPLEVIRTKLMSVPQTTTEEKNYWTFRRVWLSLSAKPFQHWFPGMSLTLIRTAPRFGIAMSTIEYSKAYFKKLHN